MIPRSCRTALIQESAIQMCQPSLELLACSLDGLLLAPSPWDPLEFLCWSRDSSVPWCLEYPQEQLEWLGEEGNPSSEHLPSLGTAKPGIWGSLLAVQSSQFGMRYSTVSPHCRDLPGSWNCLHAGLSHSFPRLSSSRNEIQGSKGLCLESPSPG